MASQMNGLREIPGTRVGLALVRGLLGASFALAVVAAAPTPSSAGAEAMNPCAAKSLNNPCNPCAEKNPCNPCGAESNPCSGKNPCNPCGANPCNPCSGKNPCNPCGAGANPCGGEASVDPAKFTMPEGMTLGGGDRAELVAEGEALWKDTSLSTNGAACATCHAGGAQFQASFATPYPHEVAMVRQMSGVGEIQAAEMVQFCMLQPMQAEPLSWSSRELVALTAYVEHVQRDYAANPCAAKGAAGANPCNPCAGKMNPCTMNNPCNPCGSKANPCSGR